jgi:hypothetical protein
MQICNSFADVPRYYTRIRPSAELISQQPCIGRKETTHDGTYPAWNNILWGNCSHIKAERFVLLRDGNRDSEVSFDSTIT